MNEPSGSIEDLLNELVHLQALTLIRDCKTQTESILLLKRAGLSNNRIAVLLGTTSATVRTTKEPKPAKTKG